MTGCAWPYAAAAQERGSRSAAGSHSIARPAAVLWSSAPSKHHSSSGSFYAAFIGFGDSAGFLAARELRDRDRQCRIVLIDDTSRYAIRGHRIHATYFIVRPLEAWHIVHSMELILGRRA